MDERERFHCIYFAAPSQLDYEAARTGFFPTVASHGMLLHLLQLFLTLPPPMY